MKVSLTLLRKNNSTNLEAQCIEHRDIEVSVPTYLSFETITKFFNTVCDDSENYSILAWSKCEFV